MTDSPEGRERLARLETQVSNLTTALERAESAIGRLTDTVSTLATTLSENKGAIRTALVFATLGTSVIGLIMGFFYWLTNYTRG